MKRFDLFAAAVLTVGGMGLMASPAFAQDQPAQAQQQPAAAAQPAAAQPAAPADSAQAAAAQPAGESEVRPVIIAIVQGAVSKGGISSLSQQFAQGDQDRLKDLAKDTTQIDQTTEQLRAAYKEKYQKDLDLSASGDSVINSQFFRIGGAGDAARQASAQIGADQNAAGAGAAGAGATGAAGAGAAAPVAAAPGAASPADSAQAAAASSGPAIVVAIPASQDMPESRLNLVREGSAWKIDLPQSVDAQQLNDRLQKHLSMAVQQKDRWPADANEAARAIAHHVIIAVAEPVPAAGAGAGATGASGTETPATPTPSK